MGCFVEISSKCDWVIIAVTPAIITFIIIPAIIFYFIMINIGQNFYRKTRKEAALHKIYFHSSSSVFQW